MRADTARRLADAMDGFPVRSVGEGFVAARLGRGVGAISMPKIPERSLLASTFAPAGPFRVFERSDPAFAISSC